MWTLFYFVLALQFTGKCRATEEETILLKLKGAFGGDLASWDPKDYYYCKWVGVQCSNDGVVGLHLQNRRLSGNIPDTIALLVDLEELNLANNTLTGVIPSSITTLTKLSLIDLSNNNLNGDVPEALFSLKNFNFSGNKLNCGFKYLHICASNASRRNISKLTILKICISLFIALLVLCATFYVIWCHIRMKYAIYVNMQGETNFQLIKMPFKEFAWIELVRATNDFNEANVIGVGAFAKVYKGVLHDGMEIAVKLLNEFVGGSESFKQEVRMIGLAEHQNVLHLLGFCLKESKRLLIYPYMPNKSLAYHLRERKEDEPSLNWNARKKIACDIARGLEFLHMSRPKVIHRDLKPANVLLNKDYEAVIADHGLVKLIDPSVMLLLTAPAGTHGYLAPECWNGEVSEKADVFSYGVMLLEIVTGQTSRNIIDYVVMRMENDEQLVDPGLCDYDVEEVKKLARLGVLCSQRNPSRRPTMSDVLVILNSKEEIPLLVASWEAWKEEKRHLDDERNASAPVFDIEAMSDITEVV